MRNVSAKLAVLAVSAAMLSLPAFGQTATAPPAGTPGGVNPPRITAAPAPHTVAKQDQKAMRHSTAMAPDIGAVGDKRASRIIGKAVVNDKDQTIGTVNDILIGSGDKATTAVISVGGFLGIGVKLVAVPFDQLQPAANDRKALTMPNASKESLKAMPAFNYGSGA